MREKDAIRSLALISKLDHDCENHLEQVDRVLRDLTAGKLNYKAAARLATEGMAKATRARQNALVEAKYLCANFECVHPQVEQDTSQEQVESPSTKANQEQSTAQGVIPGSENRNEAVIPEKINGPDKPPKLRPQKEPSPPLYCLCNDVAYGEMVACDKPRCPKEWYHLSCVGLETAPRGLWYCPLCRRTRKH